MSLHDEAKISLAAAATLCGPGYRRGSPRWTSTLFRWITVGVRMPDGSRLRLEALRIGSTWTTSREAVQRFFETQTAAHLPAEQPTMTPPRSSDRRARESQATAAAAGERLRAVTSRLRGTRAEVGSDGTSGAIKKGGKQAAVCAGDA